MKILKKQTFPFVMGTAMMLLALGACKSHDYKDASEDTTTATVVSPLPAPVDSVTGMPTDNAPAMGDSTAMNSKGMAKPNPSKKHGKGLAMYKADKNMEDQYNKMKIEMDKEGIYTRTEIRPTYPGGEKALAKFIQDNITYPQDAIDNGVEGEVDVVFAVDEKGKVYTPYIKGTKTGYGLDEEAVKVVSKMPVWNPGQIKGKNVKSYYTLPIVFTIQ